MNWLVLALLPISLAPVGVLVWWWRRGKLNDQRKAVAVMKMARYVRGRAAAQLPPGPLHALSDGQQPIPLPRSPSQPVMPVPAMSALTVPIGRPVASKPVPQSPEPALSMIAPPAERRRAERPLP